MQGTWLERIRDRLRSAWDVLTGKAYAAYSLPDHMDEVRLRIALLPFCTADWYALGNGTFQGIIEKEALDEAKAVLGMVPAPPA